MTRDKTDLTEGVRALAARQRPAELEHPTPEVLVDYHTGGLGVDRAERIREHLAVCPECVELLLDLEALPDLQTGIEGAEPDPEVAAAWRTFQGRLGDPQPAEPPGGVAEVRRFVPRREEAADRPRQPVVGRLLAAVLAVVVLGCGLWIGLLTQRLQRWSQPQLNVAVRDLFPEGSGVRGGPGSAPRPVPAGAPLVLVLDEVPELTFPDYEVVVRRDDSPAGGREVLRRRGLIPDPDHGVFTLTLPPGYLEAGRYAVEVNGLGRGERRLVARYVFEVSEPERPHPPSG